MRAFLALGFLIFQVAALIQREQLSFVGIETKKTPLDILKRESQFSKLVDALGRFPDILQLLKSPHGRMTMFAPTNEAFEEWMESLPNPQLKKVLRYHICETLVESRDFTDGALIETSLRLEGLKGDQQLIKVKVDSTHNQVLVGCESSWVAVQLDNKRDFHKGAIYPITRMIRPPQSLSEEILFVPTDSSSIMTFVAAIQYTGLTTIASEMEGLTIMAPTDRGFAMLGDRVLKFLFSPVGKTLLRRLMLYHFIPPQDYPLYSTSINEQQVLYNTLSDGHTVTIQRQVAEEPATIVVNEKAAVVFQDVLAENGVLQVIDRVLLPVHLPHW